MSLQIVPITAFPQRRKIGALQHISQHKTDHFRAFPHVFKDDVRIFTSPTTDITPANLWTLLRR